MVEIVEVFVRTIRAEKMKEQLLVCTELDILCIGNRVVVDRVV